MDLDPAGFRVVGSGPDPAGTKMSRSGLDPDPVGSKMSRSGLDPDPAGSENCGSGAPLHMLSVIIIISSLYHKSHFYHIRSFRQIR